MFVETPSCPQKRDTESPLERYRPNLARHVRRFCESPELAVINLDSLVVNETRPYIGPAQHYTRKPVRAGKPGGGSGVRSHPPLPWCYLAWIPRVVSAIAWLTLGGGVLSTKERWKRGVAAVLVALGLNVLLSGADIADATAPTAERSSVIASCREKIARWETLRKRTVGHAGEAVGRQGIAGCTHQRAVV